MSLFTPDHFIDVVAGRGLLTDFVVPMGNTLKSAAENTFGAAMEVVGLGSASNETAFGKAVANNTKEYLDSFGILPNSLTERLANAAAVFPNRLIKVSKDAVNEFIDPMNKYGVIESMGQTLASALMGL